MLSRSKISNNAQRFNKMVIQLKRSSSYEKLVFLRHQLLVLLGGSSQGFLLDQKDILKDLLEEFSSPSELKSLNQASGVKKLLQTFEFWNSRLLYHYAHTILLAWQLKHNYFSTNKQRKRALWELQMNIFSLAYLDSHFYPYLFKNTHVFVQGSQIYRDYGKEFLIAIAHRLRYSLAHIAVKWIYFNCDQKLTILEGLYKQIMEQRKYLPTILEKLVAFIAPYNASEENLSIIRFFLEKAIPEVRPTSVVRVLAILSAHCSIQVIRELSQKEQDQLKQILLEPLKKIWASKDSLEPSQVLTCAYVFSGLKVLIPKLTNLDIQQCSQAWNGFLQLLIKAGSQGGVEMEEATLLMKALVAVWPRLANKQQAFEQLLSLMSHANAIVRARVANTLLILWQTDPKNTTQLSEKLVSIMSYLMEKEMEGKKFSSMQEYQERVEEFCSKLNAHQIDFIINKCLEFLTSNHSVVRCRALRVFLGISSQFSLTTLQFTKIFDCLLERIDSFPLQDLDKKELELRLMLKVLLTSSYKLPGFSLASLLHAAVDYQLLHCNSQQATNLIHSLIKLQRHLADTGQQRFSELTELVLELLTLYRNQLAYEVMGSSREAKLVKLPTFGNQASSFFLDELIWLLELVASSLSDAQLKRIQARLFPDFRRIPGRGSVLAHLLSKQKLTNKKRGLFCLNVFNLFKKKNKKCQHQGKEVEYRSSSECKRC